MTGAGGMFWETWYNLGMTNAYLQCPDGTLATQPCATNLADRGILYENKILGMPRLRQVFETKKSHSDQLLIKDDLVFF